MLALAWANDARADEKIGSVSSPLVIDKSIEIINGANCLLRFNVRPQDGAWKSYSVAPGANIEIHCTGPCPSNVFQFSIKTQATSVNYALRSTKRYMLFWNTARQLWDLKTYTL